MTNTVCSLKPVHFLPIEQQIEIERQIGLIQLSPYRFNRLHMQNYGKDDQQQASMVFGTK